MRGEVLKVLPEDKLYQNSEPYTRFYPKTSLYRLGSSGRRRSYRSREFIARLIWVLESSFRVNSSGLRPCIAASLETHGSTHLYIATRERDELIFHDSTHPRTLDRSTEFLLCDIFCGWCVIQVHLRVIIICSESTESAATGRYSNGTFSVTYLLDASRIRTTGLRRILIVSCQLTSIMGGIRIALTWTTTPIPKSRRSIVVSATAVSFRCF
ncbi:hypothetical protein R3P38DRAFT_193484 [Favolaschia claudopus]|uniref:Uncharacterized protein n=1 Tax=Favolaschia claudopus TaxID=2862362 RepID=A0AAV9ZTW6_9AGAR